MRQKNLNQRAFGGSAFIDSITLVAFVGACLVLPAAGPANAGADVPGKALDSVTLTVTNPTDGGDPGTLRDILDQANLDGVPNVVTFDPSMAGSTIRPSSALPPLLEGNTTIDGDLDRNCIPDVVLDGFLAGPSTGLEIHSHDNVVRGLVISRFDGDGILLGEVAQGNVVECNYIGTDIHGTSPAPNAYHGVVVLGSDNRIGPGNVIAFNLSNGVFVGELYADAYPDFVGLTPGYAGVFPVMSFTDDCAVFHSADGITPLDDSGVPFTDNFGARFTGTLQVDAMGDYTFHFDWLDDLVRIIIDAAVIMDVDSCCDSYDATVYLDPGEHAIEFAYVEHGGYANFVPQISGPGVASLSTGGEPGLFGELFQLRLPADGNQITGNRIFNNEGIGIAFNCCCGPTMNDPGDADAGPNTVLNFPELTGFTDHGYGSYTVTGTAPPDSTVEIFGAASDPSGYGEGKQFLAAVAADPAGSFSVPVDRPAELASFTATATDGDGNTSEFSANLAVVDTVTVGTVEGIPGETVVVPIYVRDIAGTPLGRDQPPGNLIQGFTFQVQFEPAGSVTEISAYRSGVTAGLTPFFEFITTTDNTITYLTSYNESTDLIPFNLDWPEPGDEVAQLVVTISPAAPSTPIRLTLLDDTLLSNQAGTNIEYPAVIDGLVDIVCPAGEADGSCLPQIPDSAVKTLILAHPGRMGSTPEQTAALMNELWILASQPQVLGKVVDLGNLGDLGDYSDLSALYSVWDADSGSSAKANAVLFDAGGIHDLILGLLESCFNAEYLILIGDDRVIPLARFDDETRLYPESKYTEQRADEEWDLTPAGTTVGQALTADKYLSDDPLASRQEVRPEDLLDDAKFFIPDLFVGRLLETPEQIRTVITAFIAQDGVIELLPFDPQTGHQVLVTGYHFLLDTAKTIRTQWNEALGDSAVDELIGVQWSDGELCQRLRSLGSPDKTASLNGHATHYEFGAPGIYPMGGFHGLATSEITSPTACDGSGPLNLTGNLFYGVGCHEGLPVAGGSASDHPLDVPEALASLGVVAHLANTGYGWGLKCGVGYSELLVRMFTEELTERRTITVGEAVNAAKLRYFRESPRIDFYDLKTSRQWRLTGIPNLVLHRASGAPAAITPRSGEQAGVEQLGAVTVEHRRSSSSPTGAAPGLKADPTLPPGLTRDDLVFDFTADDVYTKYNTSGMEVVGSCLASLPSPDPEDPTACRGCYYTLNGLVETTTAEADLPIQPYFVYDSQLSGVVQQGVLWKGGLYQQEEDWVPIFGTLISDGEIDDPKVLPRRIYIKPRRPGLRSVSAKSIMKAGSLGTGTVVFTTAEVEYDPEDKEYSILKLHRRVDLEIFYQPEDQVPDDSTGPVLDRQGHYHQVDGTWIQWDVPTYDDSGVWRVVVVYDDGTLDGQSSGQWVPLELAYDAATQSWRGSLQVSGAALLTYYLQAVDNRGNVSWHEYSPDPLDLPPSGIPLSVPWPVDVVVGDGIIFADGFESGACSDWSVCPLH